MDDRDEDMTEAQKALETALKEALGNDYMPSDLDITLAVLGRQGFVVQRRLE